MNTFPKKSDAPSTPKEHVTFEIKIIPHEPTGIHLLLPKRTQCKLAGSFHVRREHAACGLTPWLIWQTGWTLRASVLLTSRPTVPCCIGVDIYETCQRGLLDLTNESGLKPTAASAAWHCHPEAVRVTAGLSSVNYHVYTGSISMSLWQVCWEYNRQYQRGCIWSGKRRIN